MDPALANRLAASVRAADPDRYFATLFAPAPSRPLLLALYAFNADGCGQKLCQPIWTGEMGGTESTPLVYNGVVYIGSDDGHLYAFNAAMAGNLAITRAVDPQNILNPGKIVQW